jgi:hypothetical protein
LLLEKAREMSIKDKLKISPFLLGVPSRIPEVLGAKEAVSGSDGFRLNDSLLAWR